MVEQIKVMFPAFETEAFPIESCIIQSRRDPEVFDSEHLYLCVHVSPMRPTECTLEHMRPYIAKEGHSIRYGWANWESEFAIMHKENAPYAASTRVVAWLKVENPLMFAPEKWLTETEYEYKPHQAGQ